MAANYFAIFSVKSEIRTSKVPLSSCFTHRKKKKKDDHATKCATAQVLKSALH